MAHCPFAIWRPISNSSGPHVGGPFKIVHHTTEGSSAQGAMDTFALKRSDPHFTVDATTIYQHVDTMEGARALRNNPGGVQTNRDSAIQIELVGFAHLPKDPRALANVARLCRWIESTHGVPKVWPSGPPKQAKNGKDPGGHNRDPETWDTQGGHYGHCHVPENTHWDPGYTSDEAAFVLSASFDDAGKLVALPKASRGVAAKTVRAAAVGGKPGSTMPDHGDVPRGISAYINELRLPASPPDVRGPAKRVARTTRSAGVARASRLDRVAEARIDAGSVVSFVDGLDAQEKDDVLFSVLLAQRGASGAHDRFTETQAWYRKYVEILENLGWATEQMAFRRYEQGDGEFRMDKEALAVIGAIATGNQLAVLKEAIASLDKLADDDGSIQLFDFHSSQGHSGNFQLGTAQKSDNGAISMVLGAFYFRSSDDRKGFLFFKWGKQDVNFWTSVQRMTLNSKLYAGLRAEVTARLGDGHAFIGDLQLGGP